MTGSFNYGLKDSLEDRILRILRSGALDTSTMKKRLPDAMPSIQHTLKRLEAKGMVRCIQPGGGNRSGMWEKVKQNGRLSQAVQERSTDA